jgi:hypothetical protein
VTVQDFSSRTSTRRGHRGVVAAGLVWAVGVVLWGLSDGLLPQSFQASVIGLATLLTVLGLIGARLMSGDLGVLTALARLKLGPWMAIGFSFGFGLATLTWLDNVLNYHGLVTVSSLAPGGAVAAVGFIALVTGYRLTPRPLRDFGSHLDRYLRGQGTFSPGAISVWTLWGVASGHSVACVRFGNTQDAGRRTAAICGHSEAR